MENIFLLLTRGIPTVIDHPQVPRLNQDDSQSFGGGQVGQGDHQLAQFNFSVLFPTLRQVLPQLHFVREIHVGQSDLRSSNANMPGIRVKVVQQHLQRAPTNNCRTFFEYKVLVEDCGEVKRLNGELIRRKAFRNALGLSVLLWILVCQTLALSGSNRIFA